MHCHNLAAKQYASTLDLLGDRYLRDGEVDGLARTFRCDRAVHLPQVFRPDVFAALFDEAAALSAASVAKDFMMRGYDTPRKMHVVNAATILASSQLLWTLYANCQFFDFVRRIVGTEMFPAKHRTAFMVLNHLKSRGATQGWHLDDGSYAVVCAFRVPDFGAGGLLEYIPSWLELCEELRVSPHLNVDLAVAEARKRGLVSSISLAVGDMYILKSDTSLHRVTELLTDESDRLVLAVGYESVSDTEYTHTGSDLYGCFMRGADHRQQG